MVVANSDQELEAGFARAQATAEAAFNDGTVFIERFIPKARHVEVQLMGDGTGKVLHFGERDCSIQRRYQKLIEEAPCTSLTGELRNHLHSSAVKLAQSVKYRNAGTAEFLFDPQRQEFYFIEVNARIQVEHPVSEMITDVDLVQTQLRIAGGEPFAIEQSDISFSGHAIECRINAEDAEQDFLPCPGVVTLWQPPQSKDIRVDSHIRTGDVIPPFYDSMIGKLIVHGQSRAEAVSKLAQAIDDFVVEGVKTTLPFLRSIVSHPDYNASQVHTRWLEQSFLSSQDTFPRSS